MDFLKQAKKASKFGLLKAGGVLSNNSVIAYYGVLRTAINRAYKEGIITVNPTKEFDFASKVKAEVKMCIRDRDGTVQNPLPENDASR